MTRVLITGITGSSGSYLAEYLLRLGLDVHGIARWHSTTSKYNLKSIESKITVHECDLTDLSSTIRAVKAANPDYIFHLAANANVHICFNNPIAVLNNNISSTINIFEAVRILNLDPVIQYCSTSEVYGIVDKKDLPIKETNQLDPVNIYAVSKLAQEKIASSYYHSYDIKVVITRMFAYINPRRGDIFSSIFTKKIVDVEEGRSNVVTHGNLKSIRTLIDVRDAMESYWVASQCCTFGTPYNIGGGTVMSVGEFLNLLIENSKTDITTELDTELLRPIDVTLQVPDVAKFTKRSGWKPKRSIEESVDMLFEYYRNGR